MPDPTTAVASRDVADGTVNAEETVIAEPTPAGDGADPQATATEGEPDNPEQRQKRTGGFLRKIEKLERELAAEKAKTTQPAPKTEATEEDKRPTRPARPKQEDFDTIDAHEKALDAHEVALDKYYDDLSAFNARQVHKVERTKQTEEQKRAAFRESWNQQVDEAKQEFPDFEEVAFNPELEEAIPAGSAMDGYLLKSGPKLVYQLAKLGIEEIQRIAKLDGFEQVEALATLKAKFAKAEPADSEETKPEPLIRAPRPITPPAKSSATATALEPGKPGAEKLSDAEWYAKRQAQRLKR